MCTLRCASQRPAAIAEQELAAFLTKYPQDEIAGAARIRHSLRPLISEGGKFKSKPRAQSVARMQSRIWERRHCERSEAIHLAVRRKLDCFVALLLAMTSDVHRL